MTDDGQLLQRYTRDRSDSAFGELVSRHVDLVYSAALRIIGGDRQLAEDVTQSVFIDLARKAKTLPRDIMLAGWLYRHTSYLAANAVRTECRRKAREQTAMEMRALDDTTEPPWERIAPHLDASLNQLSAPDRDAIVLRFLKRQELRAVGAALGVSDDAAQKRVSRAIEKLRGVLHRRGIVLPASALVSALTVEAVTAAPAGLAVAVSATSVAAVGAGTTFAFLEFMAATKLKAGLVGAIVVASVVAPLMLHHQAQATLRHQGDTIRDQADELARRRAENKHLSDLPANAASSRRISEEEFREVLRLRDTVTRLQTELQQSSRPRSTAPESRDDVLQSMSEKYSQRVIDLKQLLEAHPSEKIPEFQFLSANDWLWLSNKASLDTEAGHQQAMSITRQMAQENFGAEVLKPAIARFATEHDGKFPGDVSQLKPYFNLPIDEAILERWTVLPRNGFSKQLGAQLKEDWFITQKAPVNRALDQRVLYGLKESHSFADGPSTFWDVAP